jgi:hypothetical protein
MIGMTLIEPDGMVKVISQMAGPDACSRDKEIRCHTPSWGEWHAGTGGMTLVSSFTASSQVNVYSKQVVRCESEDAQIAIHDWDPFTRVQVAS